MNWPLRFQSLYAKLTDWCDYTPSQARKIVEEAIAQEQAKPADRRAA